MTPGTGANAFTVDLEDWFQVQAFADRIAPADWEAQPRRVEASTERLLSLLADAGVTGTFFTLGWIAERHPALIRRVVAAGHELASHGYWHRRVDSQTADAFREDVHAAKACLEDAGSAPVGGYRAPTFSVAAAATPWAWDVLAETGHRYSSSTFPIQHDLYGDPAAPRVPYRHPSGVIEVPMTTVRLGGRNLPCAGGGWFRLMPYSVFRYGFGRATRSQNLRGVFYIHPWELDPGQPRVPGVRRATAARHRLNLRATEGRLRRLLRDFRWARMDAAFPETRP
jgi:polysaccharide deacetylase family protein (PEP-CTERM system associated)